MIVVDSSAIVAIAHQEPKAAVFAELIDRDDAPQVSAASVLECSIVIRTGKKLLAEAAEDWLDAFLIDSDLTIRPVTVDQLDTAREAHIKYGKGMGHPAQLNFGDCFSYALAKSLNAPLLFKGEDFAKTDIASAL